MSKSIEIIYAEPGCPLLDQVEVLFTHFYAALSEEGMTRPLLENGSAMWRRSIERSLGSLNVVVIAVRDGRAVGFAQGVIRIGPSYLGGEKLGVVSHLYVVPEAQGIRIGKYMVDKLEAWFQEKNVTVCELNAIWTNKEALTFWKHMGFEEELVQMRKQL